MRIALVLLTWLTSGIFAAATPAFGLDWDWDQWNRLPVQDGGRQKPLGIFAAEAVRAMQIRGDLHDPETRHRLDTTAFYLTILLDWPGWDVPLPVGTERQMQDLSTGTADKWDRAPLFRIHLPALRRALGIPAEQRYVSALELFQASLQDPQSGKQSPFLAWADGQAREQKLTPLEEHGVRLANGLRQYLAHRAGMRMKVLPWPTSEVRDWRSINQLMTARFDTTSDPTGTIRRAQELWREAREAFLQDASGQFGQRSAEFILVVTKSGPTLGDYPTPAEINLELAYYKWRPFRVAWVLAAFTFVLVLVSLATGNRACYALALVAFSCALAVMCVGLGWRVAISGHAPVTNMYESIVYMGFGTSLIGLILELRRPQKLVLAASSVISAAVLLLADSFPTALDPGFRPLPPALRNDFWLVIHVLTVTFSYSAFAVALGIGNMTLGYFLVRSRDGDTMAMLGRLNYRCIQVGVLFLAVGTVTGGIWADYSWGRFWGWDPKEVWALITLFGYLAVLHARYVDWVGQFGMAALSVICFSLVVITWYGVNFLLGSGLHTYGGGSGGRVVVGIWLFVQFCFVGIAAARSAGHSADLPENAPSRLL